MVRSEQERAFSPLATMPGKSDNDRFKKLCEQDLFQNADDPCRGPFREHTVSSVSLRAESQSRTAQGTCPPAIGDSAIALPRVPLFLAV